MKYKKIPLVLIIPVIFFLISLLTLKDYGISWDEPIHFFRGQAYLYYFLTGEKNFSNLHGRLSYYQSDSLPASYWLVNDSGHPPLNGILAAFSNLIFFQKVGIMGDIESLHLFNIISATLLIFVVVLFSYQTYGNFAAIISGIVLSSYPLFFAESHFNIKDPPEAAFFTLTIWAFWMSLKKYSWKWLILTILGFSLALGTKFNIIFLPFVIIPYLFLRFKIKIFKQKIPKKYLFIFVLSPFLVSLIFIGSWPFLWHDTVTNFFEITKYYKDIGTGFNHQTSKFYLSLGFNSYPVFWILTTTPPWVLLLTFCGMLATLIKSKKSDKVEILWLLWFVIPIIRVSLPSTSIYGGIRQIMEFIPAMALLSGLGANWLKEKLGGKKIIGALILLIFIPHVLIMIKMHPNENVYFNSFIGGLNGAKEKNIPSWGNSFGNAYWQAVDWLNKNAPNNSRLALVQGTSLNIAKIQLRPGIAFSNAYWSGINRKGEYLLELTHQSSVVAYPYAWNYIEKLLDPVYELKVDGVAIAKLWKNDLEHTKVQYKKPEKKYDSQIESNTKDNLLNYKLSKAVILTRLVLSYQSTKDCSKIFGYIQISNDGISFYQEPDSIPAELVSEKDKKPNTIYYYFPAEQVKFIRIILNSKNSCIFNKPYLDLYILE